jgi:hypothetical protein
VLVEQYDPKTATDSDPQALIEEARQLQRKRTRRRMIALQVAGLLVILAFGINHLAQGGNGAGPAPTAPPAAAAQVPTVTYKKAIYQEFVPHLRVQTRIIESWSASNTRLVNQQVVQIAGLPRLENTPLINRQVVKISGGPRLEIGSGPAQGKMLGPEQANYLYDASTHTIYRTGYLLIPSSQLTPEQIFKHVLAEPGVRLAGTRTYLGRSVYVLKQRGPSAKATSYVDKRTYEPLMNEVTTKHLRSIYRTVVYKTMPATTANLALTSLPTAHPGSKTVLHATPHIRQLYGEAAFPPGQFG